MFQIIKNYDDYKLFIESVYDDFNCDEEWESFFGFHLKWNEETGEVLETLQEYKGKIKNCPKEFPVVVWYTNDIQQNYRMGANINTRQLDWISFDRINKVVREKTTYQR